MLVKDFLSPVDVMVGVKAPDKARLVQDLAERAGARLCLDAAYIARELMKREDLGSTGMGNGIAIPHTRLPELTKPFGLFVRLKRPVDFDSIDGRLVDLVFLLLQPAAAQSDLNALAAVARRLRENDRLERLRAAEDDGAFYREFIAEARSSEPHRA